MSGDDWHKAVDDALISFPSPTSILQTYIAPDRVEMAAFDSAGNAVELIEGRARFTPYYFVIDGEAVMSNVLITHCTKEKEDPWYARGNYDSLLRVSKNIGQSGSLIPIGSLQQSNGYCPANPLRTRDGMKRLIVCGTYSRASWKSGREPGKKSELVRGKAYSAGMENCCNSQRPKNLSFFCRSSVQIWLSLNL